MVLQVHKCDMTYDFLRNRLQFWSSSLLLHDGKLYGMVQFQAIFNYIQERILKLSRFSDFALYLK